MSVEEKNGEGTSADAGGREPRPSLRESFRVFCAVELPDKVREAAAAHGARLRRDFVGIRASWLRPEGLHITLKFIGEITAPRVEALASAAAAAARGLAPFVLSVEGAGAFPARGSARVLWLGVRDESGGLARLQRRLEDACSAAGFRREARDFRPHLTLARMRPTIDVLAVSEAHRIVPFGPHPFKVSELTVMRSELGPGGSRYTPLSRHAL